MHTNTQCNYVFNQQVPCRLSSEHRCMVAVEEVLLCCWLSCLPQVWHTIGVESMVPARKISDSSDNGRVMEAVASWSFSEIHYLKIYCPNFVMLQCCYDNLHETRLSSKCCICFFKFFIYFLFFLFIIFLSRRWSLREILWTIAKNAIRNLKTKSNLKSTDPRMKLFLIPDGILWRTGLL